MGFFSIIYLCGSQILWSQSSKENPCNFHRFYYYGTDFDGYGSNTRTPFTKSDLINEFERNVNPLVISAELAYGCIKLSKDVFPPDSENVGMSTNERDCDDDNADWLQNITNLTAQNPAILYPYLYSDTQNLAAYILLLHILNIDMPKTGQGYTKLFI